MQVSLHEFKSRMAKYVAYARNGETIELTAHRKVVARLTGVAKNSADAALADLLATGLVSWQGSKPTGARIALPDGGASLSAMVGEGR